MWPQEKRNRLRKTIVIILIGPNRDKRHSRSCRAKWRVIRVSGRQKIGGEIGEQGRTWVLRTRL